MSIRSMMAAFAAITIVCLSRAADTPLPITSITVNGGSVTLQWETPLGRTADDLRLEESSDLVTWDVVDNVKAPKGLGGASVSVGADTKKFFRLYAEEPTAPPPNPGTGVNVGGTFTDGQVTWRVLAVDASGNKLIVTENVYSEGTSLAWTSYFIKYNNGAEWDIYENVDDVSGTTLKYHMDLWYANFASPALKAAALNPVLTYEALSPGSYTASWNMSSAYSSAGAPASGNTGVVFPLSVSEANQFVGAGTAKLAYNTSNEPCVWWLRSPGNVGWSVTGVASNGGVTSGVAATNVRGFRPALWITP